MKYKVIGLLFIFSLSNFNIVYAFFMINDHSGQIKVNHISNEHSTQDNNVFYLYDNYFSIDTDQVIFKKRPGFVSIDKIKMDIPLKILARDAIVPQNSIDRMLLANLRIQKLISEYEVLQKKAMALLQDSTRTGMKKPNHKKESLEDKKKTINKILFNINHLTRFVQDDVSIDETIIFNGYSDLKDKKKLYLNPGSDHLKLSTDKLGREKTHIPTARQVMIRKGKPELPWIFNLVLKMLNYVINNRVEIILYMIFIALAGFFISLQLKR